MKSSVAVPALAELSNYCANAGAVIRQFLINLTLIAVLALSAILALFGAGSLSQALASWPCAMISNSGS